MEHASSTGDLDARIALITATFARLAAARALSPDASLGGRGEQRRARIGRLSLLASPALDHTPLTFTLIVLGASFVAGLFGSLVGVGGGIIVVPTLTLLLGVDIKYAIGASIVSVIATSSGAAASYVRDGIANMRIAMVLEIATAAGALGGAVIAGYVPGKWLYLLFGVLLCYTAWSMSRKKRTTVAPVPADPIADRLKLHGSYFDPSQARTIEYRVARTPLGFVVSAIAGVMSGLLGIGGGAIKVPVMNLAMGIPLKVSTATSNFMIGVTAAASAVVYFLRGDVIPFIAAPVAAGVLVGATCGSKLLGRLHTNVIRAAFVLVLLFTAVQMLWKGWHA